MKLRIKPLFRIVTALAMPTGVIAATRISGWQTATPGNARTARHQTTAVTVDDVLFGGTHHQRTFETEAAPCG